MKYVMQLVVSLTEPNHHFLQWTKELQNQKRSIYCRSAGEMGFERQIVVQTSSPPV